MNKSTILDDLSVINAIQAIEILDESTFSWFNRNRKVVDEKVVDLLPENLLKQSLLKSVQETFYSNFYCKGYACPLELYQPFMSDTSNRLFINKISDSNNGKGYNEIVDQVLKGADELLYFNVHGLKIRADHNSKWITESSYDDLAKSLQLKSSKESKYYMPGFYVARSNSIFDQNNNHILRLYWNMVPEGVHELVGQLTTELNSQNVPFRLKLLNDPNKYNRCDSIVLYIYKSHFLKCRYILQSTTTLVNRYLKNHVPAFTKKLAPGLGLAESFLDNESFGMHLSLAMAQATLKTADLSQNKLEEKLETFRSIFKQNKIDLGKPYLRQGSSDIYDFATSKYQEIHMAQDDLNLKSGDQFFLNASFEIGRMITRAAVWYNGMCNWSSHKSKVESHNQKLSVDKSYQALGPEIYSGTAGISLFLALLYANTNESIFRKTAIAACRQAIMACNRDAQDLNYGLYDGILGIALSSMYVGLTTNDQYLVDQANQIFENFCNSQQVLSSNDLISGKAGMIVALLGAYALSNNKDYFDFAEQLGNQLIYSGILQENRLSWPSENPDDHPLLGFAHGISGIAYSLSLLFQYNGRSEYLESIKRAFSYERIWLDRKISNWPDFRGVRIDDPKNLPKSFPVFWCHGAPGIALSRIIAHEILPERNIKSDALIALDTTRKHCLKNIKLKTSTTSLCHGIIGNTMIYAKGVDHFNHELDHDMYLSRKIGQILSKDISKNVYQKLHPGLMIGKAGLGYFFMFLYNHNIPSLLDFHPNSLKP